MNDVSYEGRDLEVLADMPNYYSWIMEVLGSHVRGRVVEYGAGTGTFTKRLIPYATSVVAVEPSANLIPILRRNTASHPSVEICNEASETHAYRQPPQSVDTIVMINVLEHIENDADALAMLAKMLAPGGTLLLFVPALRMLMSKLDVLHGHFRRYHRPDLETKVSAAGLTVVQSRYFDSVGIVPWFILNSLMGSTAFNPKLVRINDRFVVPATRALERRISPPFGKNLVLVSRKG